METPVDDRQTFWRLLPLYLACYLLWFAFSAVTVWTMLQFRNALLGWLPVVGPWVMTAMDKFGVLFLGLFAMGWIFFMEDYLRSGVAAGKLWPRMLRLALIQIIVLAVAYGLQLLPMLLIR